MKKILFLLSVILISGCSIRKKTESNKSIKIEFKELNYGVYTTKTIYTEKQNNSPSGERTLSDEIESIEQSNKVEGKLGQKFGVEYMLQSNQTTDIIVEQVWLFPTEMTNDKGKTYQELRYKVEKPTNDETYSLYSLDKEFEIVKGEWIFQMFYNGNKLCERKFIVE